MCLCNFKSGIMYIHNLAVMYLSYNYLCLVYLIMFTSQGFHLFDVILYKASRNTLAVMLFVGYFPGPIKNLFSPNVLFDVFLLLMQKEMYYIFYYV